MVLVIKLVCVYIHRSYLIIGSPSNALEIATSLVVLITHAIHLVVDFTFMWSPNGGETWYFTLKLCYDQIHYFHHMAKIVSSDRSKVHRHCLSVTCIILFNHRDSIREVNDLWWPLLSSWRSIITRTSPNDFFGSI